MKIAILTTKGQWFEEYAISLSNQIKCALYFNHENLTNYDIVFILSYHQIIPVEILKHNKHNIVIHESVLPEGKGWAPMFWQILEEKSEIPFTMFEASDGVDNGDIYMQETLKLTGYELNDELREKQANFTIDMCISFIKKYEKYKNPTPQSGQESFYLKRTPEDSKLDINKTIKEQFNQLRISSNKEYPSFFELDGNRYILKIELEKMKRGGGIELIDFVDLTIKEKKKVLSYRNSENTRKWMYDSSEISLDNHLGFIESLVGDGRKLYLVVRKNGIDIGIVYFVLESREAFFGLYANPFKKITGVGRVLIEVCVRYVLVILNFKKLKLEVFNGNERAIKLYEKFKFKEVNKKFINGKEVICMELKNETD